MEIPTVFKQMIETLKPGSNKKKDGPDSNVQEGLTIQKLDNELIVFFEEQMNRMSAQIGDNCRILYPMSFNILLHPEDFDNVSEALKNNIPLILTGFYGAIKKKTQELNSKGIRFSYIPVATYWFFQWASCRYFSEKEIQQSPIEKGEAHVIGSMTTFDITNREDVENASNTRQTHRVINSCNHEKNINMDALIRSDLMNIPNADKYNFDNELPTDINVIMGEQRNSNKAYATLYVSGRKYLMLDDQVTISGSSETRAASSNLIVIDNPNIVRSHVQIRYDKARNIFKICAYAPIVVNERPITLSVGGQPVWEDLSLISKIFFSDALLTIEFDAAEFIKLNYKDK